MTIGERISNKRNELGYSQEDLALKCGWSNRSSISKIESSGDKVSLKKIEIVANALNVSAADLMGWNESENNKSHIKGIKIPILGRVIAGIPIDAIEEIIGYEEITEEMSKQGDFFALRIKGDSMSPRILENDIVIVQKQSDAENGDLVIALVNGYEATCKKLIKYATGITLQSFNPSYEPMFFSEEEIKTKPVEIIGKVVELRGKF